MTIADKIYEEVRALPDPEARAVLDFIGTLKAMRQSDRVIKRKAALERLAHYRGRFKVGQLSRDEFAG